MSLKLILPTKKISVNGKEITIPKLGLKHHNLVKNEMNPIEALNKIMGSIYKGLTAAENDFVALHLLEFNGKLKSESSKDGFKYSLSDMYICQKLEFQYGGHTYKFKSHSPFDQFGSVDMVLQNLYIGDLVPDFMDMPAFVSKWADEITTTIAIPGPNGPIKGMLKIMEILNGE